MGKSDGSFTLRIMGVDWERRIFAVVNAEERAKLCWTNFGGIVGVPEGMENDGLD